MARPRKPIPKSILNDAYWGKEMSTTEISSASKRLFGFSVTPATVYNCIVRYGIRLRSKSEGVSKAKSNHVNLRRIVRNKADMWNARWLISSGVISCKNSILTKKEARKLERILAGKHGSLVPNSLIEAEFKKAREQGFPYNDLDHEERLREWGNLLNAKTEKQDGMYTWAGSGSRLATCFHPHFYECKKSGKMSPLEFFMSDVDLKRGIMKSLCLNGTITESRLRDICRNEDASSAINNFPPRVAMAVLHELFPNAKGLKLLDPCSGFSGRMIGCAAASKVDEYWGIDLSKDTFDGLIKTSEFLKGIGCPMETFVFNDDCVSKMKKMNTNFDVVFTSPPFLDVEEYKGVAVEHDYDKWLSNFIEPFITGCKDRLKPNGKLVIYSENINLRKKLADDFSNLARKAGLLQELPVVFKKSRGTYQRHMGQFRSVPIYVWSKP